MRKSTCCPEKHAAEPSNGKANRNIKTTPREETTALTRDSTIQGQGAFGTSQLHCLTHKNLLILKELASTF